MLKHNRHDVVLHDPSEELLIKCDNTLCYNANKQHRYFRVEPIWEHTMERWREDTDHFQARGSYNGSIQRGSKMLCSIAGIAWFTLVNGGRHVRLFSDRCILGFEYSIDKIDDPWWGGPTMIDPFPCECVYPCLYLRCQVWPEHQAAGNAMADVIMMNPLNPSPRRMFADWLRDQGEEEFADDQLRVVNFIEGGCQCW